MDPELFKSSAQNRVSPRARARAKQAFIHSFIYSLMRQVFVEPGIVLGAE